MDTPAYTDRNSYVENRRESGQEQKQFEQRPVFDVSQNMKGTPYEKDFDAALHKRAKEQQAAAEKWARERQAKTAGASSCNQNRNQDTLQQSRAEKEPLPKAAQERAALVKEYNKAIAGGFRNINKRDYFEDDDTSRPKTEQLFETPWQFHKQPVVCYTIHGFMKGDPLEVMAFYVEDSEGNTHNITNQLLSGKDKMQNASGQYINTERACNYMTQLSDVTKQLPHVQTCDEYMSFQSYFRGYMGVEKPTISDYTDIYLPACRDRLRKGDGIVGSITSVQDLHYAYESAEYYR